MKSPGSTAPARASRSMRERAHLIIQQKIAHGDLPPGAAVSEIPIAQELASSRTPVREALGQLAAEGLLEQRPHRGMVVVQFGRQDIVDLYELREALEVYAVGKAARQRNSSQEQQRLQSSANEILALKKELKAGPGVQLDEKQMRRFIACDLGFHTLLLRLAANVRIQKVVNEARLLVQVFSIRRTGHDTAALKRIFAYHQGILGAVMRQDHDEATSLMARHIQESQQERLSEFDRWEHEASIRKTLPI